jgi:hypothetical protein
MAWDVDSGTGNGTALGAFLSGIGYSKGGCRNRAFLRRINWQRRRELRWPSRNERLQPLRRATRYTPSPTRPAPRVAPVARRSKRSCVRMFAMVGRLSAMTRKRSPRGGRGRRPSGGVGPFFTGAVHGSVSLADVASPGTEPTKSPTSIPVPPPSLALFYVRLLPKGWIVSL